MTLRLAVHIDGAFELRTAFNGHAGRNDAALAAAGFAADELFVPGKIASEFTPNGYERP
jgi:hypothetical protein